ncbi:MAG: HAD-IIIA family hydrolase [Candidatus Methylomirabilales bacterium]
MRSSRPTQAVILAGGRGLRLRPLTDSVPKPMVSIHGRPFMEYLLDLLHEQGFEKALLLVGYRGEVIQGHFGDGAKFGLHIEYSVAPEEAETGRRLQLAAPLLDPHFMLLYCDNYWPLRMVEMWDQYTSSEVPAMVTVYTNRDQYTRNNVRVNDEGYVLTYDKSRSSSDLNGVEIGYALLRREVLDLIPSGNVSFEAAVYPYLAQRRMLRGFLVDHRYYSIGSLERLLLAELFLSFPRAVILDRDGVLNKKAPPAEYVGTWDEFEWLPGAVEAVRLLKRAGYKVIVVSNQAGIARGMMSEADVTSLHERMQAELSRVGAALDAIYYCPHGWEDGCACRKPKPGMLLQAQRDHHLDLTKTYVIGDDERDVEAGRVVGCRTFLVSPEYPLIRYVHEYILRDGRTPG